MVAKQQKIQLELAFDADEEGEALGSGDKGTEANAAKSRTESSASTAALMEEVCERENLKAALRRVQGNKGGPGIDGMTVEELQGYLKEHWLEIRGELLSGTVQAAAGKAGRDSETGRRGAKARDSNSPRPIHPTGDSAGSSTTLGPDVFRVQLWISAWAVGTSSGRTGAGVRGRRLRMGR